MMCEIVAAVRKQCRLTTATTAAAAGVWVRRLM
jgi:hypothetical protein